MLDLIYHIFIFTSISLMFGLFLSFMSDRERKRKKKNLEDNNNWILKI